MIQASLKYDSSQIVGTIHFPTRTLLSSYLVPSVSTLSPLSLSCCNTSRYESSHKALQTPTRVQTQRPSGIHCKPAVFSINQRTGQNLPNPIMLSFQSALIGPSLSLWLNFQTSFLFWPDFLPTIPVGILTLPTNPRSLEVLRWLQLNL